MKIAFGLLCFMLFLISLGLKIIKSQFYYEIQTKNVALSMGKSFNIKLVSCFHRDVYLYFCYKFMPI